MLDRLNRPLRDLRISVTDRCNLRCPYCMPRETFGPDFAYLPADELLSFEEIARLTRILVALGVRKVRLTGGEPLLRADLPRLVEMLSSIDGIEDLALTTNGILLARNAQRLADAGLGRVTVSLDSLDPGAFRTMSGSRLAPSPVLAGIERAKAAGLGPVKVNMVVRRGISDHSMVAMAEHFRHRDITLRFIEYMDVGSTNSWVVEDVLTGAEVLEMLSAHWPMERVECSELGTVARRFRYLDGAGEIGLIQSVSAPFCTGCTRARLSAEGNLYTCLFAQRGYGLRRYLRDGSDDSQIARRLGSVWERREDRYSADRATAGLAVNERRIEMSYIGG